MFQSGHEGESGIGTMTTGSKQETTADNMGFSNGSVRLRCRLVLPLPELKPVP